MDLSRIHRCPRSACACRTIIHHRTHWAQFAALIQPGNFTTLEQVGLDACDRYSPKAGCWESGTVEPAGESARFTRAVEMRPSGLRMLITPTMALMIPRRTKVFVQNLRRALES
jgi:hypothetical protein